jgi:hypothetical protein
MRLVRSRSAPLVIQLKSIVYCTFHRRTGFLLGETFGGPALETISLPVSLPAVLVTSGLARRWTIPSGQVMLESELLS